MAVGWAHQRLAAPRWWRIVRDAGTTALVVICLAALVTVLANADGLIALSATVTCCLPLGAGWAARQARVAAALVALTADPLPKPVSGPRLVFRAVLVFLVAATAASTLVIAIAYEHSARYDCPSFAIDALVHDWWEREGGRVGVGCPAGDTRQDATGVRHTPWLAVEQAGLWRDTVVYVAGSADPMTIPRAIFTAWTAAGGPSGALGEPTEGGANDVLAYMNFRGGAISLAAGGTPVVHSGQRYSVARPLGSACEWRDRPCITAAYADAEGIHLRWQYGAADAFNVGWWPEGSTGQTVGREVAGYELTVPNPAPGTVYLAGVQACDKQFLRRSICTESSTPVRIRVG